MKFILLALAVLPFSLEAAYNYSNQTDLWASTNDIPHYQSHQVGIQPNLKNTADFRPGKHDIPYIQWETIPSTAPAAPASGRPCIILISGGAYNALEDFSNPNSYQTWKSKLSALGIQCVHLFYRTPRPIGILREDGVTTNVFQSAWDDGQRAVRMIRSMAAEKNVDPNKIGVVGMSAGSHLATLLATSSQTPAYPLSTDDVDKVSAEINVALTHSIAYGMSDGLTGPNKNGGNGATLDTVFRFDEKTCPMCMTHGGNDPYSPISSSMVWRRLDALGIPAELHTYPDKTHTALGFDRHLEFLRKLGWLPSEPAVAPDARWPDESACGRISNTACAGGSLVWYHPAVHSTGSVQIILKGAAAVDSDVSAAITSVRRYLNAAGITVVIAPVRAGSAVDDARAAVAAVKAETAKHGLDAGYVGLMGFRADANTAVEAATTSDSSVKAKWAVAVSPETGTADAPLAAITSNATPPTLFLHEGIDAANSSVGSVASWEKQRTVNVQGAVHTFGGEGADFISAAAVPGTGAYTYRERIRDFLSDKKFLATWTEPPPPERQAPVLSRATAEVSEDGTSATLRCALESLLNAPVEVVLELNGQAVKIWDGLSQPADLTFDVSVVPASTNVFSFVATDAAGLTGSSSGGFVATVYTSWFTVDFDGDAVYAVGSPVTGVPSDRGTWSLAEGTAAELKTEGGATVLAYGRADGSGDAMPTVVYTPTEPSETGADVVVTGWIRVEACPGTAPSMADHGDSKGAFCFVKGNTIVPYGHTADGWRALSGGDELVEGDFGEYTIRTIFSGTNGNEVAYAFEGWTGGPWSAANGPKSVTRVRFVREGLLGSFSGSYYSFLAGGDTPIEIVKPEFATDGSALAFGGAAGSETFSLTISNPVKGAYYTVFTSETLTGTFTAEKASVLCDTTAATYTLTVDADTSSKFAKIVISLAPFAAGAPLPEK